MVAFEIDEDKIDDAVKIINSHPGVSHNYERNHQFNIWFTMAVAPDSALGLERTVEILADLTKANDYIILPTLKLFKINVKLNTTGKDEKKEKVKKVEHKDIELTQLHHKVIEKIQYDIKFIKEPFAKIVDELEIDYDTLFNILSELQDSGMMRRFASILNHRKAGFNANAMVVWDVDETNGEEIGANAAAFSELVTVIFVQNMKTGRLICLLWCMVKQQKKQTLLLKIWQKRFQTNPTCHYTHQESLKKSE